jgi:hypothetical protein
VYPLLPWLGGCVPQMIIAGAAETPVMGEARRREVGEALT